MLTPVELLTARIEQAGLLGPMVGVLVGVALTHTPIAWPSLPAVVALVGPARAAARQDRPAAVSGPRGFAVVVGFVIGMDGVIATLSAVFLGLLVALTRAAVVLTVVAIVVLTYAGVRLLLANGPALCRRLEALPPDPLRAVSAGVAFSVSGCPGCAPPAPSKPRRRPVAAGWSRPTPAGPAGSTWPLPLSCCCPLPATPTGCWTARCSPPCPGRASSFPKY